MERIINDNVGLEVLIVTHRMTLKVIMAYFLNKSLQEIGELPDILSTALCKVTLTDNNTTIDLYGDTSHYQ